MTAAKFVAEFGSAALSPRERAVAAKVLEVFAADVAREVREAVAEQVKNSLYLPRKIALRLASDVDSVAIPILRCTSVLTDDDLISVVRGGSEAKQIAIANREAVSEALTSALIGTGRKAVASTVLGNKGAAIDDGTIGHVLDHHIDDREIQELLVSRPKLPPAVIERLVAAASEELRATLLARDDVPAALASRIVDLGRDSALATQLRAAKTEPEMKAALARMAAEAQLTPIFLMRVLVSGDVSVFEHAIAELARVPVSSVRDFLYNRGAGGVRQALRLAHIPDDLARGMRTVIRMLDERRKRDPEGWRRNLTSLVIDRLVTEYPNLAPGSIESILSQIAHRILGRRDAD